MACNMPTCRSQDPSDCIDCVHKDPVPRTMTLPLSDPDRFETIVRSHILRDWDRHRIERFAKHLLGDRCQECHKGEAK